LIGSASTARRRGLNGRSAALIPWRADSTRDRAASARHLSHQFAGRRHEHVLSRSRHGRPPPSPSRRASWCLRRKTAVGTRLILTADSRSDGSDEHRGWTVFQIPSTLGVLPCRGAPARRHATELWPFLTSSPFLMNTAEPLRLVSTTATFVHDPWAVGRPAAYGLRRPCRPQQQVGVPE